MEGVRTATELWVFGYGSLIWRPGDLVHTHQLAPVCIRGYRRVFYQGSTDHRGVPGAPGRVVTLLPDAQAVTWGTALRLPPPGHSRDAALAYLEEREKQYDIRLRADVFSSIEDSTEPVVAQALVFVASSDRERNVNYLGPAPVEEIAETIATRRGPSGPNCQYLFMLADAMRGLGVHDEELVQLEALVRQRQRSAAAPAEDM
jgi:cation transport regulator ChaC